MGVCSRCAAALGVSWPCGLLSPWSTCALVQGGQARPTPFSSLPTALSYLSTDSQLPRQLPGG